MKEKSRILDIVIVAVGIILAVIEYFVLPDRVAMQVGASGNLQNFAPKRLAVLAPFVLIFPGAGIHFTTGDKKWLVIGAFGLLVSVLILIINLI